MWKKIGFTPPKKATKDRGRLAIFKKQFTAKGYEIEAKMKSVEAADHLSPTATKEN